MNDYIKFCFALKKASETALKFASALPEDTPMACSIISTMVDAYCGMHDLNAREIWKNLYEISGQIYENMGPMNLQKGGGSLDTDNLNI